MDEAVAGFVGAIAGSIATIGTQSTIARFDRKARARTAAPENGTISGI